MSVSSASPWLLAIFHVHTRRSGRFVGTQKSPVVHVRLLHECILSTSGSKPKLRKPDIIYGFLSTGSGCGVLLCSLIGMSVKGRLFRLVWDGMCPPAVYPFAPRKVSSCLVDFAPIRPILRPQTTLLGESSLFGFRLVSSPSLLCSPALTVVALTNEPVGLVT